MGPGYPADFTDLNPAQWKQSLRPPMTEPPKSLADFFLLIDSSMHQSPCSSCASVKWLCHVHRTWKWYIWTFPSAFYVACEKQMWVRDGWLLFDSCLLNQWFCSGGNGTSTWDFRGLQLLTNRCWEKCQKCKSTVIFIQHNSCFYVFFYKFFLLFVWDTQVLMFLKLPLLLHSCHCNSRR